MLLKSSGKNREAVVGEGQRTRLNFSKIFPPLAIYLAPGEAFSRHAYKLKICHF